MSNTTDIYWDVDGQSLHTWAWNIETLGGERDGVPPFRGENMKTPYRPGTRHAPKLPDERTLTLLMWTKASDQDGVEGTTEAEKLEQMFANRRALKRLFWNDNGQQVNLTKRWYEGGDILSATAKVELANSMAASMSGPYLGKFSVDLLMADPFFYADIAEVDFAVDIGSIIHNPGDAWTTGTGCKVEFHGPLTNPKLTNLSPTPNIWFQLATSIATGDFVTVDFDNWTVTRDSDGANLIGGLTHSGAHQWLKLRPGDNALILEATSGTGSAHVLFAAPYL